MSLSLSSLALFLLLIPGLIFRFFVYHGSLVKRDILATNPVYAAIAIILYSTIIHVSSYYLAMFLSYLAHRSGYHVPILSFAERSGVLYIFFNGLEYTLPNFIVVYLGYVLVYGFFVCVIAYLLARTLRAFANRFESVGRLLYGSLASLISSLDVPLITCFALSKITYEDKQVLYAGVPVEIGLKEGSKIDYIVLEAPAKFYLRFEKKQPQSTFSNARELSPGPNARGFLYISGEDIENVHFEGWYF